MYPDKLKPWLLAILLTPCFGAQASTNLICKQIQMSEQLTVRPPAGWVPPPAGDIGQQNPETRAPDFAEIFVGHPALNAAITPTESTMTYTGGTVTWRFDKPTSNLWLGCQYDSIMLVHPIHASVTFCRATVTPNGPISIHCD